MTIYTYPTSLMSLTKARFALRSLTAHSPQSAFNNQSFTSGPISEFWVVSLTVWAKTRNDLRDLRSLLFRLRGGRNPVRLFDLTSHPMRGAGGLSPTLNIAAAAVAGAESIEIKGLTPSQAVAIAADDKIGIGENLYSVMSDSGSDASGHCTVELLPALRLAVAEDDPVNTLRPTGLFRLMSQPEMDVIPGEMIDPIQLEFMEDPDVDQ